MSHETGPPVTPVLKTQNAPAKEKIPETSPSVKYLIDTTKP